MFDFLYILLHRLSINRHLGPVSLRRLGHDDAPIPNAEPELDTGEASKKI